MNNYIYFVLDSIARYQKSFAYIFGGCFFLLFIYLAYTPRVFLAETKIQLLDSDTSSMLSSQISEMTGLGSLVGVNATSAIGAEITIFKSREVLSKVVSENQDNITFVNKNLFKRFFSRTNIVDKSFKMQAKINKIIHPSSLIDSLEFTIIKLDDNSFDIFDNDKVIYKNAQFNDDIILENYGVTINIDKIMGNINDEFVLSIEDYQHHIDYLNENIIIRSINEGIYPTGIFSVRFFGVDKDNILKTLNLMNKFYIEQNIERVNREISKSIEFISIQTPILIASFEDAQNKLSDFQKNNNSIDLSFEMQSKIQELLTIDESIYTLKSELAKAELSYGAKSKVVLSINSQIKQLDSSRELLSIQINNLPDFQKKYVNLLREVELNNLLVTTFTTKKAELELIKAGALGNARILDTPFIYPEHTFPNTIQSIMGFLLLAITFFGFIVFYHYSIIGKINSPSSLVEFFELKNLETNIMGVIPKVEGLLNQTDRPNLANIYNKSSSVVDFKEIMEGIRQNIIFNQDKNSSPYKIAVLGGNAEIGKSFLSSFLAMSLSEVGKTLIIDFDLKKGILHKNFSLDNEFGILDSLANDSNLKPTKISDNLDVLTRGKIRKNKIIKVANRKDQFLQLLEEISNNYDYILFDTPPVLITNDILPFLSYFDKKLLVVNEHLTSKGDISSTYERLDQLGTNIDGILYNFHEQRTNLGYYSYSYRYGGNYNYSYNYYSYKYGLSEDDNE